MSRSQAGIVCSADRSTTHLANVQHAASQPFPRSLPPSSLFSPCLSVLQEVHPWKGCQVTTSAAHCSVVCAVSSSLALPAFFQYVSINLLHLQTLHLTKDAQGSGAGEGMVRGVAASGKEGVMKKIENKY